MADEAVRRRLAERLVVVSDAPELEAGWLLEETTNPEQLERLVAERATGKPLAYVLGHWDFYGRTFAVTPDVLIPRPTTELLVEEALKILKKKSKALARPLVLVDIGTGSGCVAITLLLEGSGWIKKFYVTDISPAALVLAKKNAAQYGVLDKIEFLEGNLLEPFDFAQGKPKIDLIVSNPPYVPTAELERSLASPTPDTLGLRFEPRIALDGGQDGQKFIEQIKTTGIPAVLEITGGIIRTFSL